MFSTYQVFGLHQNCMVHGSNVYAQGYIKNLIQKSVKCNITEIFDSYRAVKEGPHLSKELLLTLGLSPSPY